MKSIVTKVIVGLTTIVMAATFAVIAVYADGTRTICTTTYGGATECREEITREEIVHTPVETGIVDEVILPLGLFAVGYGILVNLYKRAQVVGR